MQSIQSGFTWQKPEPPESEDDGEDQDIGNPMYTSTPGMSDIVPLGLEGAKLQPCVSIAPSSYKGTIYDACGHSKGHSKFTRVVP